MRCPLCHSGDIAECESIQARDLVRLYQRGMHVDISELMSPVDKIDYYNCRACDLHFFLPPIAGDGPFYETLQNFSWYYEETKQEFSFAATHIQSSTGVLEVGSGKGAFRTHIVDNPYIGLEFNDRAVSLGKSRGLDIRKQSIESHAVDMPEFYDVVCNFQVLEHVSDPRCFLESCIACLKPGGKLIVSVPSLSSFSRYLTNHILDLPPHHLTRWTDKALGYIADLFGLLTIEIWHEPLQPLHYSMYAKTVVEEALGYGRGKLVDTSLRRRAISKIAAIPARFYCRGFNHSALLPRGISVTAVYQKKAGTEI